MNIYHKTQTVDLSKLTFEVGVVPFAFDPGYFGNRGIELYRARARLDGESVSKIVFLRAIPGVTFEDEYWFDDINLGNRRFVVRNMKTEEPFKGNGIMEKLLIYTNNSVLDNFGVPLSSDVNFARVEKVNGFDPFPGRRVWEKLESKGKAYSKKYYTKDRWVMLSS